jgi:hypothetical protein
MFQYLFSLADKKGSSSKEIPQIQHHPPENGLPQYPHLVDTLDDRVTEMQISTAYTHTHTTQHEDLLQISNCCALIRNNTLSIVNHTLLVEA